MAQEKRRYFARQETELTLTDPAMTALSSLKIADIRIRRYEDDDSRSRRTWTRVQRSLIGGLVVDALEDVDLAYRERSMQ